jgi:hypothetical protein
MFAQQCEPELRQYGASFAPAIRYQQKDTIKQTSRSGRRL